jgi:hypothetical protein
VLVEGQDGDVVRRAADDLLARETLLDAGAAAVAGPCVYELEFALGARPS